MRINKDKVKNILVVRNDRFGEFLLNIPALRALKETFVNAKVIAVVNPAVVELAMLVPFIDEVMAWAGGRQTFAEKLKLFKILRKRKIDIAIMLNPCKAFNIFTFASGIPVRVGYDRKWGFLLTHKIKDKKHLEQRHEVEYNLELVGLVGAKTKNLALALEIGANISDWPKELSSFNAGENFIVLHPFTSDALKQWPLDNFYQLADRLVKESHVKVVIVGGKEEYNRSKEVFRDLNNGIINLTAKLSLRQLAALFRNCRLVISGDSGPMHLACTVGAPVVAIFRNDLPGKTARRWGPWQEGHIVIEKNNLCDITVNEVFYKASEVLSR